MATTKQTTQTTKATEVKADETKGGRDSNRKIEGLESNFKDVLIASGVAFVTVGDDIKTVKKNLVEQSGLRVNKRTNIDKQALDLTLKNLRQKFNLKGSHLEVRFLQELQDGKLVDERGKEVIHFQPQAAS